MKLKGNLSGVLGRLKERPDEESPWKAYREYFLENSGREAPELTGANFLPLAMRRDVLRSLAVFQLGETGEGRIVNEVRRSKFEPIDSDYQACLESFVAEEGKHAGLLGKMIRSLGGRLIRKNATGTLFQIGRRLMGVRLKLTVLLAAEVISLECYGLLARRIPLSQVRDLLLYIRDDEMNHLRFHADFFHRMYRNPISRQAHLLLFRFIVSCAVIAVALDHRHTFKSLGVTGREMKQRFRSQIHATIELIKHGANQPLIPVTETRGV